MVKKAKAKKGAKKATKKTARRKRPTQLDYEAAQRVAAKGATNARIAKAAGSKARDRGVLRKIGARIKARLEREGSLEEIYADLGLPRRAYCKSIVEAAQAMTVSRVSYEGQFSDERTDIDWRTRLAALDRYAADTGIRKQAETPAEAGDALAVLSDELLVAIAGGEVSGQDAADALAAATRDA